MVHRRGLSAPPGLLTLSLGLSGLSLGLLALLWRVAGRMARQARELAALQSITETGLATLDLEELLIQLLGRFAAITGADAVVLYLIEPDRPAVLTVRKAVGIPDEEIAGLRVRLGEGLAGRVAAMNAPLWFADAQAIPWARTPYVVAHNIRAILAVPLRARGRLLGVVESMYHERRPFAPDEVRLLEVLAERAGLALENARLYAETVQRAERSAALARIIGDILTVLELPQTLQRAVSDMVRVMQPVDAGAIVTYDPTTGHLVGQAAYGLSAVAIQAISGPLAAFPVAQEALETRRPIAIDDASADPRVPPAYVQQFGVRSLLVLPLIARQRWVGVLFLFYTTRPHRWTEDEVAFAADAANEIALAIEVARLYDEARQRAEELEEARQRRVVFTAAIAHDLQGMLQPLLVYSEMLRRETPPSDRWREAVESIAASVRRLQRLANDLADVATIEAGRFRLRPQPCDLIAIVRRTVQEAQATTGSHQLVVEAPEVVEGRWDPDRLAQVLNNLLNNAIRYSPQGGVVRVRVTVQETTARVCVSDQGIGLRPEELAVIFEPWSRLYRERPTRGLGLGLFIARTIVESHGGRIWATSEGPGRGATFCFTLPGVERVVAAPTPAPTGARG